MATLTKTKKLTELETLASLKNGNLFAVHDGNGLKSVTAGLLEEYIKSTEIHNIPRSVPKDITKYVSDGSLWNRISGTNGYSAYDDIFVGDYIKMSRPISAYEQTKTQQLTGSQYVTVAGCGSLMSNGDYGQSVSSVNYNHLVMVPGQGFGGIQHFGRSRMKPTDVTEGGDVGSEMFSTTLGAVATTGFTGETASINQQLYAEFGAHLKTTRELLSNAIDKTFYNRYGNASGASSAWAWTDCQAVLMSEVEVYGSTIWSSSGYDIGNAKYQLPLFRFVESAISNRTAWYWLKAVASAVCFCIAYSSGIADCSRAGIADGYVRPRFIIA